MFLWSNVFEEVHFVLWKHLLDYVGGFQLHREWCCIFQYGPAPVSCVRGRMGHPINIACVF